MYVYIYIYIPSTYDYKYMFGVGYMHDMYFVYRAVNTYTCMPFHYNCLAFALHVYWKSVVI